MRGGLVAPDSVAPSERSSVGQSQEDAGVDQGGEGGVEVLLQGLLQQALLRKVFLKNRGRDGRDIYATRASSFSIKCYLVSMPGVSS